MENEEEELLNLSVVGTFAKCALMWCIIHSELM